MTGRWSINLRGLDALRGILATYVLVGHARWLLWAGHDQWQRHAPEWWEVPIAYGSASFRFGREAVMVFFVLSGFFIHLRAAEQLRAGAPVQMATGEFFRRRAHRLLAPYLFALAVTVVLDVVGRTWFPRLYASETGDPLLDQTFALGGYGWTSVVPALSLLPSSLGRDFGTNGPLWSLAFEVVYYALYPAWLLVRRRSAVLAFVVVPGVCFAVALAAGVPFLPFVLVHYPIWLTGALLAEQIGRCRVSPAVIGSIAGVLAAGVMVHFTSESFLQSAIGATMYGGSTVAAFAVMSSQERLRWWWRAFEFLGVRSYTLYIVHFPFLALLSAWLIQSQGGRPLHGWLALGGVVLALAFGSACFAICERHFLHPRLRIRQVPS